ncbi:unnamed protein product [Rotaria sordida]|uniref:Uncharacterized protein n=1 Tax=Rotaria sordida TaxID=392033 RepID=A0A814LST8_9BILA|nr:unnamed protein product [Rotaria sordida]
MSTIHFLAENSKNSLLEDINSTKISFPDSFSHSRQGWRYLVQYILNNKLYLERKLLQFNLDSNVFQQYQYQFTKEYKIEENERIYKTHALSLHWLPSRSTAKLISIQIASILRYPNISANIDHIMIIPFIVQFGIMMNFSEIEDLTKREQNKVLIQKHVTMMPPNKLTRRISINLSDKRNSFIEDNSFILSSPKWCPSLDEQQFSSLNLSNDLHQIKLQPKRINSYLNEQKYDEYLSLLNNTSFHKHQQYSFVDITNENNLSRLSLHSISYGFGLGIKTWKSIYDEKNFQHKTILSSSNYHLPSNKIELDRNQQEMIRRTGSFKRKSDMIL